MAEADPNLEWNGAGIDSDDELDLQCEVRRLYPSASSSDLVRALLGLSADASIPDGRDDHTLYVYDRLTLKNPYLNPGDL